MNQSAAYPSQETDRFLVRFPYGLRDRIHAAAKVNNRSMNSEIVATLAAAYPARLSDQDAFALLDYLLAAGPGDFESRKAEVNAKLAAHGMPYEVTQAPNLPGRGRVAISRKVAPRRD